MEGCPIGWSEGRAEEGYYEIGSVWVLLAYCAAIFRSRRERGKGTGEQKEWEERYRETV